MCTEYERDISPILSSREWSPTVRRFPPGADRAISRSTAGDIEGLYVDWYEYSKWRGQYSCAADLIAGRVSVGPEVWRRYRRCRRALRCGRGRARRWDGGTADRRWPPRSRRAGPTPTPARPAAGPAPGPGRSRGCGSATWADGS